MSCVFVSASLQAAWIFSSYNIPCIGRVAVGKAKMYDKKLSMFPIYTTLSFILTLAFLSI